MDCSQTEVAVDLEKLCGWSGGKFAADLIQHNGSPRGDPDRAT